MVAPAVDERDDVITAGRVLRRPTIVGGLTDQTALLTDPAIPTEDLERIGTLNESTTQSLRTFYPAQDDTMMLPQVGA